MRLGKLGRTLRRTLKPPKLPKLPTPGKPVAKALTRAAGDGFAAFRRPKVELPRPPDAVRHPVKPGEAVQRAWTFTLDKLKG